MCLLFLYVQGKRNGLDMLIKEIYRISNNKQPKNKKKVCPEKTVEYIKKAEEISKNVIVFNKKNYAERDRKIDRILTNKATGIPIMICLLALIFWITIVGANYPSEILYNFFDLVGEKLYVLFDKLNIPTFLTGIILRWWIQGTLLGSFSYASTNGNLFPFIYAS